MVKQREAEERNMGEYEAYRYRSRKVVMDVPLPAKKEVIAITPVPENYPEEGYP